MLYRSTATTLLAALCLLVLPAGARAQEVTGFEVDSLAVGMEAPTFVMKQMGTTEYVFLRDLVGELRQQAVFRGDTPKTVILSFYATWCKPCAEEAPVLAEIAEAYAEREVILFFVNFGDTDAAAAQWMVDHDLSDRTVLMDPFREIGKRYGVNSLPRTIVIDKEGIVRHIARGFADAEEYRTAITTILETILTPGA